MAARRKASRQRLSRARGGADYALNQPIDRKEDPHFGHTPVEIGEGYILIQVPGTGETVRIDFLKK